MSRFELPCSLVESLELPYPDRDELRARIAELPRLVAESEARWSIRVAGPFQAGRAPVGDPRDDVVGCAARARPLAGASHGRLPTPHPRARA